MKRRTAIASIVSLAAPGTFAASPARKQDPGRPAPFPPAVRAILDLPEDRIDVGRAALTFAQVIFQRIDIDAYSARIDTMVREARQYMAGQPARNHVDILIALNTYIFNTWGFQYDHAFNAVSTQSNYFINGALDTKKGMCITMPMLYLAVSQRLGLPIYPVAAPQHSFLRYMRFAAPPHNIEVTSGGGVITDEGYIKKFEIPLRGVESGAYLRTLKLREYLGHIMIQNALVLHERGRRREAFAYLRTAADLDARDVVPIMYLSQYWNQEAFDADKAGEPTQADRYFEKSQAYKRQAAELGFALAPKALLPKALLQKNS